MTKDVLLRSFERSVRRHLGLLAEKLGSRVEKLDDGILEVGSDGFSLRISGSRNHGTDLVDVAVILFSTESKRGIGLANIMEFRGHRLMTPELRAVPTAVDAEVRRLSDLAHEYCEPFLSGQQDDWDKLIQFMDGKIARSGVRDMKFDLPGFVRQEWEVETGED